MGAIVDAIVVIISSSIGLLFKKGIPSHLHERVMEGIGLAVLAIAIPGIIKGQNTIVMILSLIIGIIIGELINLEKRITDFALFLEMKFAKKKKATEKSDRDWVQAFISASLITCVGSMTVIGSLESGLTGNNTTLYSKSIIDGIATFLLATSMGPGVILSFITILVVEGLLILFANMLSVFMPVEVIAEMSCVGSIILIGLGLNILKVTELKILNFTPAILVPIILMLFM